jgi:hypothetical protein
MARIRPPFDPELEAALEVIHEVNPPTITPERIGALRAIADEYRIADEALLGARRCDLSGTSLPPRRRERRSGAHRQP